MQIGYDIALIKLDSLVENSGINSDICVATSRSLQSIEFAPEIIYVLGYGHKGEDKKDDESLHWMPSYSVQDLDREESTARINASGSQFPYDNSEKYLSVANIEPVSATEHFLINSTYKVFVYASSGGKRYAIQVGLVSHASVHVRIVSMIIGHVLTYSP